MEGNGDETACVQEHTYVIDHTYRLVYLDSATKDLFPFAHPGDTCFAALRGIDHICKDCPWHNRTSSTNSSTQNLIYNRELKRWLTASFITVEWPQHGDCVIIAAKSIDETNKNLLYSFSQQASYDELFEIDKTADSYRVLYCDKNKYIMPALTGKLSRAIAKCADVLVHPSDREEFLRFWEPGHFQKTLEQHGMLKSEYRKKLRSGEYRWVTQTVVPVQRGECDGSVFFCFVIDIDNQKKGNLERKHIAGAFAQKYNENDPLTGLFTNFVFYEKAEAYIEQHPEEPLDMLYLDIEHFKILNEWYGRDEGDRLLKALGNYLARVCDDNHGIAGYFGGDDFVMLLPHGVVAKGLLEELLRFPATIFEDSVGFLLAIGICEIEDRTTPAATLCDHALTALNSVKGNYTTRIGHYDSSMTQDLEQEPKILLEVQRGLKNHEFVLYWQPKCNITTHKIIGLEALVRWQHPERGLVMPNEFIPLLEKTGFIASLDLFVWEEACRILRVWIDQGHQPIPVSINISRADMYSVDVAKTLEHLISTYRIDRALLELEITESAYVEDSRMSDVATQLQGLGYTILMDDFGSGYSSLNMLKDIKVDILKIDMGFLKLSTSSSGRGENILQSVVSMARLMELNVIAEGVETQEQVDFLASLGCNYVQGYFFFKPMSCADTKKLLLVEDNVDYLGMHKNQVGSIRLTDLVHDNLESQTMLDNLLGGMAIYELCEGHFELLQVNDRYCRIAECTISDLEEHRYSMGDMVHPDDLDAMMGLFDYAEKNPATGAEGTIRRYRLAGGLMWVNFCIFFLREQDHKKIFYATLTDVTDQKKQEEALAASQEALNKMLELSSLNQDASKLAAENR
ncbi:MAG: EAL domain-containing protein [Raoultibacter sp.]